MLPKVWLRFKEETHALLEKIRKIYPCNVGSTERIARVVVGAVLLILSLAGLVGESYGFFAGFIGALGVVSGVTGHCPVFLIFNIKTTK